MTPRTPIVAVPYAYRIATIDGATGGAVSGNINLDNSSATTGNILKGGAPFIHNFGFSNTFIGRNAGNLVMTGSVHRSIWHTLLLAPLTDAFEAITSATGSQ